ncbi:DUF6545 domain-containing protein [Streptomyces sp. NPDC052051]|uniref:DUF6545 domain-containing protein n=1 Tax=Streptomyces sp. NPDC052051 TaxID=3154649 RepID=UPI00344AE4A9
MDGRFYYLTALVLWTCLVGRIPRLLRGRRDPALISLCAVVLMGGLSFALSAPASVAVVNRLAGVPNIDLCLTRRETGIRDGLTRLGPRFDDRVRARAYDRAVSRGVSAPDAEAIGTAAMVAAARAGTPADPRPIGAYVPTALDGTLSDLVRVSRAVRTPVVADVLSDGRRQEKQRA